MWWSVSVLWVLLWGYALSEKCTTPLGKSSKCVPLHDCLDLLTAFKQQPSPNVLSYLQQSKCGYRGTSKVCCGPVPDLKPKIEMPETTTPNQVTEHQRPYNSEYSKEDSLPAPRDQCGIDNLSHRIFSGVNTEIDEFPWMVLLGYKNSTGAVNYKCGGSLINRRYVLTAAHCLVGTILDKYGPLVTVRLGEYDMSLGATLDCKFGICSEPPQEIAVASTYAHPKYEITNPNRTHDIGLVRLESRAVYTYYVQPICLGNSKETVTAGEDMFFSGWGETLAGPASPVKQKIKLSIFNKDKCVEKFRRGPKVAFLSDTQLCAGGVVREGGCQRDSGGPLMKKTPEGVWVAVGVSSFGRGCGLDGWPDIYTSVAGYMDWILFTLKISNQR